MNVLIEIGSLGRGGAERQVVQLAGGLAARGHKVCLVVERSVTAYHGEIEKAPFTLIELRQAGKHDVRVLWRAFRTLRSMKPDVCMCVGFPATLWGRLAALMIGCPVVTTEHATRAVTPRKERFVNRLLQRWTVATVACTGLQVPYLVAGGYSLEHVRVVNNGVDVGVFCEDSDGGSAFRRRYGIPDEAFVVGLVAAHRREKRHDRFVDTIVTLATAGLDVWGCMIGGGSGIATTRSLVEGTPIADRFVITGPIEDMKSAYSALDVVVLVSDRETFPLCFLEAQACGRPVVGMGGYGGVAETMDVGMTGLLVPGGDMQALAAALQHLAHDKDLRLAMGHAGREWVGVNLSLRRMVDRYERLLEAVATQSTYSIL